jgi:AcrR family transcriptional regulator
MAGTTKRPYDARRRRERAETERRATQLRVVKAAHRLFLARGYAATTMADVAREAGVALQSVYKAAQSKADLMHLVVDLAVAGDDEEVTILERPSAAAVAAEGRPERQVEMIAALITATLERLAPVWVAYRDAAAVDPKAAENLVAAHRRRRETFMGLIAMLPEHRLRRSPEESADSAWAIGSIDVFILLRAIRGWDGSQYSEWLSRTLVDQLLTADGRGGAGDERGAQVAPGEQRAITRRG